MKLIVGLGNPGTKYAKHRHNVGFFVAEELRAQLSFPGWREKFNGFWTKGSVGGTDVALLEPMTYMNDSGRSVQAASAFFHAEGGDDLLVVHDELDLPFGEVRLKVGGGHAGHNGLRSIIGVLGPDFARVRVGIGRPPAGFRGEVADFVLQSFDDVEAASVPDVVKKSVDAALRWVKVGSLASMNETNARPKKPPKPPKEVKSA